MTVEELEMLVYTLRDEVSKLRAQIRRMEDEESNKIYDLHHFARDVVDDLNDMHGNVYDMKKQLDKHCKSFHSVLVIGGDKGESNIS